MSSKTSSRSTLTTVPSTMSPSLKYLMVSSIAARKASSDPMSLTATLGVEVASVLLVIVWAGSECGQGWLWARSGPRFRHTEAKGALRSQDFWACHDRNSGQDLPDDRRRS